MGGPRSIITPSNARYAPWRFAGSKSGGERAAAMYSLIGTAKLNGIEPEAYLREVLTRIVDHPVNQIDDLLPWNIASSKLHEA